MLGIHEKRIGFVTTPERLAQFLIDWAVRRPADRVLDVGTGEGVFAFGSYRRLRQIGASEHDAAHQLYGAERDDGAFATFAQEASASMGVLPPHIYHDDFFHVGFPTVDAVVGNPPYVGRVNLQEIEDIRSRTLPMLGVAGRLGRLADIYCYFLLHAGRYLRPGGRLAVVVSSSWMDVDYGVTLKQWLLSEFNIRAIVGFERRVFKSALVKAVLVLAERKNHAGESTGRPVRFIRIGGSLDRLTGDLLVDGTPPPSVRVAEVSQASLDPHQSWSIYLKNPEVYFALTGTGRLAPLRSVAESRIGLQTLAGGFYIMTREQAAERGIEPKFLAPLAFSPRQVNSPILRPGTEPRHYVFLCDRPIEQLEGTRALEHIRWGEKESVPVRGGAGERVTGYQNAPRLKRAGRKPWYNLRSDVDRRGRWPIMIPRRVYETFSVVWNQAGFVVNENFIEVRPKRPSDVVPLLVALGSSVGEFIIRAQAQIYGGGVFNLNPDNVRYLPILDLHALGEDDRRLLSKAYSCYTDRPERRDVLDEVVLDLLGQPIEPAALRDAVNELRSLATVSKEEQR